MARPALPARGATNWDGQMQAALYSISDRADQALASAGGGASAGTAALETFAGTGDDAKLTAAMSYAGAQTHPPTIRLSNGDYSFSTARTLYTGFRLSGPMGAISNSELAAASMPCKVTVTTNGTWLNVSGGDVFDAYIGGITFIGGSSTTFLNSSGGSVWHCSHLRDVSFHAFKSVLGTQASKLLSTASLIDGWFQVAGTYNGGIHVGGSDNRFWTDGALIDASTAYNSAGSAAGQFHMWFDGFDNSYVGPLYITAEGGWGAIKVTGPAYNTGVPSNLGMVTIYGATIEGRNASAPCNGALVRIEGGIVKIRDAYISRAMSNAANMGHSPADAGAIHVTNGGVLIDGCTYDRYSGQAETVPFVYAAAGNVRVFNTFFATKGGTWTGLPRVKDAGATVVTDTTVTVI